MTKFPVFALLAAPALLSAQAKLVHVPLTYHAPVTGQPRPNFSPKGEQVVLTPVKPTFALPTGAILPAKTGTMKVGPDNKSWVPILVTATREFPNDLCLLFIDRNRNGNFADDGAGLPAKTPAQNAKTKAWWSSTSEVELTLPYTDTKSTQKYFVNFWAVREDSMPADSIIRYSVGSWREGSAVVNGRPVLVAAMDDNNAIWDKEDMWSVIEASAPKAPTMVLTIGEARNTSRFMFVKPDSLHKDQKELVLEFKKFAADGSAVDFEVVDRDMTKEIDRAPDDALKDERGRPRTTVPFVFEKELPVALAKAKASGKKVFMDFATTWCGPCAQMDQWIYTDKDVAAKMNEMYIGVKLDGDIEKALVKQYEIAGYPHMLILDADGKVLQRAVGYLSSKQIMEFFRK